MLAHVGDPVAAQDPVLLVRHRAGRGLADALNLLAGAIRIEEVAPDPRPLIVDRVRRDDDHQ